MVLPATVVLAAASLRLLEPRQYQSARTGWIILEWATTLVARLGETLLFLGMPGVVVLAGCGAMLRMWRRDHTLLDDVVLAVTIFQPHLATGFPALATLLGAIILAPAFAQLVAD